MKKRTSSQNRQHFARYRLPSRTETFIDQARRAAQRRLKNVRKIGLPISSNPIYTNWLRQESMLASANRLSRHYSGSAFMWQKPYAKPRPRSAVKQASVWYTAYPLSVITREGETLLQTLGDPDLWQAFEQIGINAMHTGPMKVAGGLDGWKSTASIDGFFDRVSTKIDPVFGYESQYLAMSQIAKQHGGIIIDDIVPGHTGKGADFRLAEMKFADYPGIYHMIEIDRADWNLLPTISSGKDSANLSAEQEQALKDRGYIVGRLQRTIFYEKGVKETNWSATRVVRGVDGIKRRWVYLHYFKAGQPSLNWLDPSFSAMKLVIGDAIHSLGELDTGGLRLDANGFLGVEIGEPGAPAWSEGHPVSAVANQIIGSMIRKLGGFSFQELNLSIDDIKLTSELGADLSYDFITRPAYHHAIVTADTEFLRLMMRESLAIGVDPASLVHALQNHDELTHELVHFWTVHADDNYHYHGEMMTGKQLRERVISELRQGALDNSPYNMTSYGDTGISSTTATVIASGLGFRDLTNLTREQIDLIKQVHLLLVKFNAWQAGVLALSGWDLVGALTLEAEAVSELIREGDTRWINRGAYDLMDVNAQTDQSASGLKKAPSLYGSLPEQLASETSFVSGLKRILATRDKSVIATSSQVDIPDVDDSAILTMVHLTESGDILVTVLNFSNRPVTTRVRSSHLPPNFAVIDVESGRELAKTDQASSFELTLDNFAGYLLKISPQG